MNRILHIVGVSLLFLSPLLGKDDYRVEEQEKAMHVALSMFTAGQLKQKENGFVYLDVSNGFIDEVAPLLEMPGRLQVLPTATRSTGAHVSVFYESEEVQPKEIGNSMSFEVNELRSFTLHTRDEVKKLWVIAVNSPELEGLRSQYGLSPLLKGKDFHITIGKQLPVAPLGWQEIDTLSEFNFLNQPTLGMEEKGDFVRLNSEEIAEKLKVSENIGQLSLKSNGFVFLDVDNKIIDEFVSLLPTGPEFTPTSTKSKSMGAHVSGIYESEMISKGVWELENAGEWFIFDMKEVRFVDVKTSKGKERLWLLAVDCPALQRLRQSYQMKPKLQGHDFHITLGKEPLK